MRNILAVLGALHIAVSAMSIAAALHLGYHGKKIACHNSIAYNIGSNMSAALGHHQNVNSMGTGK